VESKGDHSKKGKVEQAVKKSYEKREQETKNKETSRTRQTTDKKKGKKGNIRSKEVAEAGQYESGKGKISVKSLNRPAGDGQEKSRSLWKGKRHYEQTSNTYRQTRRVQATIWEGRLTGGKKKGQHKVSREKR